MTPTFTTTTLLTHRKMATTEPAYNGPSAREMIDTHTLAHEIITRHGTGSQAVFDDANILQLKRYLEDPALEKAAVLAKLGAPDDDAALTIIRQGGSSLVDYVAIVRGTPKAALTADEEETLRTWFNSGGGEAQGY